MFAVVGAAALRMPAAGAVAQSAPVADPVVRRSHPAGITLTLREHVTVSATQSTTPRARLIGVDVTNPYVLVVGSGLAGIGMVSSMSVIYVLLRRQRSGDTSEFDRRTTRRSYAIFFASALALIVLQLSLVFGS